VAPSILAPGRDDCEVSTPEIDLLVELAYDRGALADG
jgi:hypothetical protein